jgi:hypothetical protein
LEVLEEIRRLAALGMKFRAIGHTLGFRGTELEDYAVGEAPEVLDAYNMGRADGELVAVKRLNQRMEEGDVNALKFFLSAQHKWSDKVEPPLAPMAAPVAFTAEQLARLTNEELDDLERKLRKLQGTTIEGEATRV